MIGDGRLGPAYEHCRKLTATHGRSYYLVRNCYRGGSVPGSTHVGIETGPPRSRHPRLEHPGAARLQGLEHRYRTGPIRTDYPHQDGLLRTLLPGRDAPSRGPDARAVPEPG